MSNALALSAVTATLQYWLSSVLNDPSSVLGSVLVTAKAPDLTQASLGGNDGATLAVNLFLHQVTPNAAWRNVALPVLGIDGTSRLQNQPLALDLHYLLTAYGTQDTEAEALLGMSVLMLHQNPVLTRNQIGTALSALPSTNPYATVLSSSGLADQIELVKVTPATLGREEMAWLWTALKADYRPTFPFQVSVVLIQTQFPTVAAPPVQSRILTIQSGGPPQFTSVAAPGTQAAANPGQTVLVTGVSLSAITGIVLVNGHLGVDNPALVPLSATSTTVSFIVPNLPAGAYQLTGQVSGQVPGTIGVTASTNSLLLAIAPAIVGTPTVTLNAAGVLVTVVCSPAVLAQQSPVLLLAGSSTPAQSFADGSTSLSFQFPALPAGAANAMLQVDGIFNGLLTSVTVPA